MKFYSEKEGKEEYSLTSSKNDFSNKTISIFTLKGKHIILIIVIKLHLIISNFFTFVAE